MPRHRFTVLFLAIALAAGGAGSACKKKRSDDGQAPYGAERSILHVPIRMQRHV